MTRLVGYIEQADIERLRGADAHAAPISNVPLSPTAEPAYTLPPPLTAKQIHSWLKPDAGPAMKDLAVRIARRAERYTRG